MCDCEYVEKNKGCLQHLGEVQDVFLFFFVVKCWNVTGGKLGKFVMCAQTDGPTKEFKMLSGQVS